MLAVRHTGERALQPAGLLTRRSERASLPGLVGIKGRPRLNRNIDADVIVAEVGAAIIL